MNRIKVGVHRYPALALAVIPPLAPTFLNSMRSLFFFFVVGIGLASAASAADHSSPTVTSATDPLLHLQAGHPRLLFNDVDLKAALAAAKTDSLRAALHARIVAVAEAQLKEPHIVYRLVGPRLLDQSRKAIAHILTNAMAFRLSGDERFADYAKQEMLTAAAFADWHPAHFLDVAEMSCAVAIGYDWLYARLSAAERATIKKALVEKSLSFANAAYAPNGPTNKLLWFVNAHHNWNQVCNGGLLAAALALADEEPELARTVIAGARTSLPLAMMAYAPDGAYPEGPGYWDYGTGYNVIAIELLRSAVGTDFGLAERPGFDRTALYRLQMQSPTGLSFNYADGGPEMGPASEYTWLAKRFHLPTALAHSRALLAAECAKGPHKSSDRFLALHAVWFPTESDSSVTTDIKPTALDAQFHGPAELAIFRSAWNDPAALWVGVKGGNNAVNHAHLDLGSFVLDAEGVRWALDLGPDDYNLPDYFGAKRWSYFRLNNHSHNTISPDDALQNPQAAAPIIFFKSAPREAAAIVDLSAVYPGAAAQLHRGVAMLDRSRVLVQDEAVGLKPGAKLIWRMLTSADVDATDGRMLHLKQKGHQLDLTVLSPSTIHFATRAARPPTAAEKQNDHITEITLELAVTSNSSTIAVLLSPVKPNSARTTPAASPTEKLRPLSDWSKSAAQP